MHRSHSRRPSGFTLVEMLVVIAVIGILLAIVLPATQSARESGRRTQCLNNQRQIALAAVGHAHRKGYLPGWRNNLVLTSGGTVNPSWPVMVMPYMERSDIYNLWQSASGTTSITPTQVTTSSGTSANPFLDIFCCPSQPPSGTQAAAATTLPWLAYAGNAGTGTAGTIWDGVMTDITSAANRMALDDITDGTAYTLLVAEKCGAYQNANTGSATQAYWSGTLPTGSFSWGTGITSMPVFGLAATAATGKVVNAGTALTAPGAASQPSSAHPGGAVASFCDGHTIFLRDTLQSQVYAELCTSRDARTSTIASGTWNTASYTLSDGDYNY